jgi:hypothetical protein
LRTDPSTVTSSSGFSDRMSTTSIPRRSSADAASRQVFTIAPYASRVTAWPSVATTARSIDGALDTPAPAGALSQYRRFGSKKITGSGQEIACWIMVYASAGFEQATTRRPAVWVKYASGDSLWCSAAPMPPPNGIRITTRSST